MNTSKCEHKQKKKKHLVLLYFHMYVLIFLQMNSFLWHCCDAIYSVLLQNGSVCSLKWMFDGICRPYVDVSSECCTLTTCNPVLSTLHQVTQRSVCVYLIWFVNVNYLYFSLKRAFVMYCITVFLDLSCHSAIGVELKITL